MAQDAVAAVAAADLEVEHGGAVVDRRAEAVDARHRGHDDHVAPLEQRPRGVVAQPVDLVVAGRVLLDVRVGPRQIGLGLEVVVVADEVLDRVVREELLELLVELRRQRLVVRHHQRRLLHRLDHLGGGEGLAGAGGPSRTWCRSPASHPSRQLGDRLWLVSGWLEGGDDLQVGHGGKDLVRATCGVPRSYRNLHRYRSGTPERPIGRVTLHFYIGADAPGCPESRSSYSPGPAGGRAFVACRPSPGGRAPRVPLPGQAMVEFAAVLLPLLLLIVGIVQFGLLFGANVTLTNAAREAARAGTIYVYDHTHTRPGTTPSAAATWPMRRCSRWASSRPRRRTSRSPCPAARAPRRVATGRRTAT